MEISIRADTAKVRAALQGLERQAPFAVATAINRTLDAAQAAERADLRKRFTLRRPQFADLSIKRRRADFATKTQLVGILRVEAPAGKDGKPHSDVWVRQEVGGAKTSTAGGNVVLPQAVKTNKAGLIPDGMRPRSLLKAAGASSSGRAVRGAKRTFLVRSPDGRSVILQRTGRGKESWDGGRGVRHDASLRILYTSAKSVRIPQRMHFVETVSGYVRANLQRAMEVAVGEAIRTARK